MSVKIFSDSLLANTLEYHHHESIQSSISYPTPSLRQVCKPDGSSRKTLITGLSKPRAMAVDYQHGHIYWSEWGTTPRIARAHTDGTHNWYKLHVTRVLYIVCIIYWACYTLRVYTACILTRISRPGTHMVSLYEEEGEVGWPNGMTIHHEDRILYWADAKLDKVPNLT